MFGSEILAGFFCVLAISFGGHLCGRLVFLPWCLAALLLPFHNFLLVTRLLKVTFGRSCGSNLFQFPRELRKETIAGYRHVWVCAAAELLAEGRMDYGNAH